jgi:hypothetical protein
MGTEVFAERNSCGYSLKQVFTLDETDLVWMHVPNCTFISPEQNTMPRSKGAHFCWEEIFQISLRLESMRYFLNTCYWPVVG